ncbi:hypothetical protein NEIRO02_0820 [Nematocida sp. AWRm79]|nr:hypothetical protein NEIRO02_0820 [Nematocida sp. AWRm79]
MTDRLPNTVNIIKKLTELLPSLSEAEAEAARYQIEQLKDSNPFLSGKETEPQSILECWETRGISRAKVIMQRITQDRRLLEGYNVILQDKATPEIEQIVDKIQRVLYFLEREILLIKRLLSDAFVTDKNYNPNLIGESSELMESFKIEKHSGKAHLSIVDISDRNPLHKGISIMIYTDDVLVGEIALREIQESKSISIDFKNIYRMEIVVKTEDDVIIGNIFFPIEDLADAEDIGVKNFYYSIIDKSTLSISFGKCILESNTIHRALENVLTKRVAEHLLRKIESISVYRCGVCGSNEETNDVELYYRCDMCKFTCHMKCTHLIFFVCNEFKKKKEIESEKKELEEKLQKIKQKRIRIISAAIAIKEKPKKLRHSSGKANKKKKNIKNHSTESEEEESTENSSMECSSSDEESEVCPTKRYSVEHSVQQEKMLGATWCCHCGERIGMLVMALVCSVCENTYHTSCRKMLFHSCGITLDLLIGLISYMPKRHKKKSEKISLDQFKFISPVCVEGFAKVYLCEWNGKPVGLKAIKKKTIIDKNCQDLVETQRTCLEIAKASKNPFLLHIKGYFQTKTYVFFITEFVPGGDLYFHLQNRTISADEIQMILAGLVLAIEWLHSENIIYRDLRLENVMFSENGYIKLTNLSLCSIGAHNGIAHTLCGSIPTIAPEMIDEHYTSAVDWWSLGVLAYQLILKSPPFSGTSIKKIKNAIQNEPPASIELISEPARSLIMGLLEKDPEKRLGTHSSTDIKNHEYFKNIDWEKMEKQELPVEWVPKLDNSMCSNFDSAVTSQDPELSPGEEVDSAMDMYFENF